MTDPKRWLDEPPFAGSLAEQMILAGKRLDLPPEVVERSLAEFSAQIATATVAAASADSLVGAGGSASSAATTGVTATGASAAISTAGLSTAAIVKSFVVGALLGVGVSSAVPAARYLAHPAAPAKLDTRAPAAGAAATIAPAPMLALPELAPSARSPAETPLSPSPAPGALREPALTRAAETGSPRFPLPQRPVADASKTLALPSSNPPAKPTTALDENRLKLEALELARANNLLESGDPRAALAVLQQSRARFDDAAMAEERDALAVEALARQGDRAQAQAAARRFLTAFPNSPLAARVKRASMLE